MAEEPTASEDDDYDAFEQRSTGYARTIVFSIVLLFILSAVSLIVVNFAPDLQYEGVPVTTLLGIVWLIAVVCMCLYQTCRTRSAQLSDFSKLRRESEFPTVTSDSYSAEPATSDTPGRTVIYVEKEPVVYVAPSRCPHCGAPMDSENAEWVGPLQVRCPSCGHVAPAEKHEV